MEKETSETFNLLKDSLRSIPQETVPQLPLNLRELPAVYHILTAYRSYLRNHGVLLSSRQRLQLRTLDSLCVRLSTLIALGNKASPTFILLSLEDLEVMGEAVEAFVRLLPRLVPQSKERDEVIADVKKLGQHLDAMIDQYLSSMP